MPRVIIHSDNRPYKLMTTEGEKKICMCGLSKTLPFCDESHHKTDDEDPNLLYQYDADGNRSVLEEDDEDGCCGGHCGCGDEACGDDCSCNCAEDCKCGEDCKCDEKCCCDDGCGCNENCSCGEACNCEGKDCEDDCECETEVTEKPQKSVESKKHSHSK